MEIVGALGDTCDLIWVIDSERPLGALGRLLPRLGTVVDRAGLSPAETIAAVRAAEPEGVVAFTDSQLATASMIADGLGLRFNPPDVTARFLDKFQQRAALQAAGIPVPRIAVLPADATAAQLLELTARITYPAVLKPRN